MSVTPQTRPPVPPLGLACAAACLLGMVACLWRPSLPSPAALWAGLLCGLAWWAAPVRGRWLGAAMAGFAWTGLQAAWSLDAQLPPALEGRELRLQGQVVELPVHEARRTRFLLRVEADANTPAALHGRSVRLSWYDDYGAQAPGPRLRLRAGERWRFHARVRAPRGLANPGGFDSERHALAQRIGATGYVRHPAAAARLSPPAGLDAWREAMSARIGAQVRSESSRYVRALALGDTRALDDRDWEILRAAGLTHLIAISGFHVGLVAGCFALIGALAWRLFPQALHRLPRPQLTGAMALLGAAGYAAVAGFALPTVRTVLMIAVVVLARLSRRPARVADSLALAMLAVLAFDPLTILAAGFWLSFAGVAWLAWCLPQSQHWAKGFLSAQGVATLGLLPLTAVLFGQASLVGPFANLVAIPWWSLVVVPLSLIGTALEAVHAGWGGWAWRLAAGCFDLTWPWFVWLAQGRLALWWLPESHGAALPLALLGAFWLMLPRGVPGKPLALLLWLPLLWPDRELPKPGEAELVVIDVGQGLSVLVRTSRHALLYDAGPAVEDGFDAGERAVVPALHALGVARLDRLVVSHGDNDHAGGVDAVRRVVPVGESLAPEGAPVDVDGPCRSGQSWEWDGVRFRFLHPTPYFPYLANEASCVLRVETRNGAALLTGDIGEVIERELVRREPAAVRADVVLAAHHGSGGSSDPAFVAATAARLVLISNGYRNRFGHPKPHIVARWRQAGAEVLSTETGGALRVWLENGGLAVRERRHARPRLWDPVRRSQAAGLSYRPSNERPDVPED